MTKGKTAPRQLRKNLAMIHQRYYNTTHYIAVVVTMILILQIWWMLKGAHQ